MLDVDAEWHSTLLFLTVLGMQTTQSDELFADGTFSIGLLLAASRMLDDPLHLLAAGQAAVGISALVGMDQ